MLGIPAELARLAAWLLVSLVLALWLRRRPLLSVSVALAVWSLLPALAGYRLTGQYSGPLAAHPATWMLLVIAATAVLLHPGLMGSAVARYPLVSITLGAFVVVATLTTAFLATTGAKLLLDQIVAPLALFWVVVAFAPTDPRGLFVIRNTVIGAVTLQAALAVVEWLLDASVLYASDYTRSLGVETLERWPGTTDSHLVLAFAICVAAPLTVALTSAWARVGLLAVQGMGALVTQSRFALAALALAFVYILVRGRMSAAAKVVSSGVLMLGTYLVVHSALATGVKSRLEDDSGSAGARLNALDSFTTLADSYWWTGDGLMANYDVAFSTGLGTSFESSFMMYAVDVGILASIAYFGTMLVLIITHGRRTVVQGSPVAALLGLLTLQVFSGLGYSNLAGAYLWAALALVVAGSELERGDVDDDVETETSHAHGPAFSARRSLSTSSPE